VFHLKTTAFAVTQPVSSGASPDLRDNGRARLRILPRIFGVYTLALADQTVVSATSFMTTVIISRFTDPEQLGAYAIGISVLASAFTIQGQLISLPYSVQRHRPFGTPEEHAGGSLVLAGLLGALITLLLTIAALNMLADGARPELTAITWALAGLMPFALFRDFFRRFAFTHLQMGHALMLDAVVAALQLSMLGWLGWSGQMSAVTASIALGASCGIAALGWLCLSRARFAIRMSQVRATMKQSWNLGKWLVVNQVMVQVQRFSTYWLLAMIAGAAVTGVYTACMSIVAFANPVFFGLNNLLTQKSVLAWKNGGGAGLRRRAFCDLLLLGMALGPFCLLALWVGDDVMRFLYHGKEYQDYSHIIAVLAFGVVVSALGSPAGNALASMERPRVVFVINAAGAVITILLVWRLMTAWGLSGAAYGWLSSNAVVTVGLWAGFLLSIPQAQDDAPRQVLQKLNESSNSERWTIARLGEGDHSNVYVAYANDDLPIWPAHSTLVIKVYKPEAGLTIEMVNEQFASLSRLYATLDGRIANGWRISTPRPLYICNSPLALVMTAVPGKKNLKSCAATDNDLTPELLDDLGRAVVAAMQENWSRGELHGDLGLQNVLYDIPTMQLSFIDSGTRECCIVCNDKTNPWRPAVLELGHILRDLGTDVHDMTGNPIARLRRKIFTESALRAFLEPIVSLEERQRTLDEIRACAQVHLSKVLEPSWSLRGLLRRPLTRFAVHRMNTVLAGLKVEPTAVGGVHDVFQAEPIQQFASLQINGLDESCVHLPGRSGPQADSTRTLRCCRMHRI